LVDINTKSVRLMDYLKRVFKSAHSISYYKYVCFYTNQGQNLKVQEKHCIILKEKLKLKSETKAVSLNYHNIDTKC